MRARHLTVGDSELYILGLFRGSSGLAFAKASLEFYPTFDELLMSQIGHIYVPGRKTFSQQGL
jgi:hypothetical protein